MVDGTFPGPYFGDRMYDPTADRARLAWADMLSSLTREELFQLHAKLNGSESHKLWKLLQETAVKARQINPAIAPDLAEMACTYGMICDESDAIAGDVYDALLADSEVKFVPGDEHPYVESDTDPGNCDVCHFYHR
jgi:hypothetical protein